MLTIMAKLNTKSSGIAAAFFLFLFNTFFAIGWLGMTWLYPAEIVPLRIRASANAFSTSANWAFNFMGALSCFLTIYFFSFKPKVFFLCFFFSLNFIILLVGKDMKSKREKIRLINKQSLSPALSGNDHTNIFHLNRLQNIPHLRNHVCNPSFFFPYLLFMNLSPHPNQSPQAIHKTTPFPFPIF